MNRKNPDLPDDAAEIGAIVHDLRNVLSAVRGFATVISEDLRPGDPAREDLDQILKAVEHGTQITMRLAAVRSRVNAEQHPVPANVDPDAERSSSWGVQQPRRSGTILVVEDDDLVRTMTVRVLRRHGYATLDAATPSEAEDKARQHAVPLDLLLADVGLPESGGLELALRLRQRWPSLKVLFMSGLARAVLADLGVAVGGAFLEKPFAPVTLVERIDAMLAPGTS
ncbi:MAG TPA: response regulator [Polyangia bacterium]|nr:response regulator [Polyangia bacterium]